MVVARRYARALYEEAERASKTDAVDDDMELIRASLRDSAELTRFFRSPVISREKKQNVVRELYEERVDHLTYRFLETLISKHREDVFPQIATAYRDMRDEHLGIVEARARAAWDLSESNRDELVRALGRLTGKDVRLEVEKDESLIGGLIVRVGDTVYDSSVLHQLDQLRDRMEIGSISSN